MQNNNATARSQEKRRAGTDLPGLYRPIGIAAVAGALSAGGTAADESARHAANNDARQHDRESTAANNNDRQHDRESLAA